MNFFNVYQKFGCRFCGLNINSNNLEYTTPWGRRRALRRHEEGGVSITRNKTGSGANPIKVVAP